MDDSSSASLNPGARSSLEEHHVAAVIGVEDVEDELPMSQVPDAPKKRTRLAYLPSRTQYVRKVLRTAFTWPIVIGMLVAAMSGVYFGALWHPVSHLDRLKIVIVNADQGIALSAAGKTNLGNTVLAAMTSVNNFHWRVRQANATSYERLRWEVQHDKIYTAVWIPANFSTVFFLNFYGRMPNVTIASSYSNNIVIIEDTSKQFTTTVAVESVISRIVTAVTASFLQSMYKGSFGTAASNAPADIWITPVGYTTDNFFPKMEVGMFLENMTSGLFCWVPTVVIAFASITVFSIRNPIARGKFPKYSRLTILFMRFLLYTVTVPIDAAVIMGIARHFGLPAAHGYARIWGTYMLAKLAFGYGIIFPLLYWLASLGRILCMFMMIIQICTCGGVWYRGVLSTSFKNIGAFLPMTHVMHLLRYSAYGTTPDHIGRSVGILFAWVFGGLILSVLGLWFGIGDPNMTKTNPLAGYEPEPVKDKNDSDDAE